MGDRQAGLDFRSGGGRVFLHVLLNTVIVSVINFTVWFAVTFWVFIETRSVFATGMIAGIFLVAVASTGIWFGSLVDHHRKKTVMQVSAAASFVIYAISLVLYLLTPGATFRDPASPTLWVFVVLVMLGVIAGNPRTIALPTLVTLLIPADRRDRANGLVGTATGVSFLITSVISGVLVAAGGMLYVLILALVVVAVATLHLSRVTITERDVVTTADASEPSEPSEPAVSVGSPGATAATVAPETVTPTPAPDAERPPGPAPSGKGVDLRGTLRLIGSVPGLPALIGFSCFNNFLGGAFMALLDAYGLSLVSVQAWGLLSGVLSTGMIIGGLLVAKVGLSSNPVRTLLLVNLVLWTVTILFPLRSSVIPLAAGIFVYMLLVPFAEAAEQTILQKVVPYERQGRVFGFAQSVELAASPLTAFMIGPLTQFVFIPLMTDGAGAAAVGGWFGTGPERGIALVFVLTGVLGTVATLVALGSRYYRQLSRAVGAPADEGDGDGGGHDSSDAPTQEAIGPHAESAEPHLR